MKQVPIAFTDDERSFGGLPPAVLKNRFVEQTMTQEGGAVFLARPGNDKLATFGTGPIRGIYSLTGLFGSALFVASGNTLYRYDTDGTAWTLVGYLYGTGNVSMTGVSGAGYQHLIIADGSHLQLYTGGTQATGTLTATANFADGDTVTIGSSTFEITATITDGAGTAANPWKVLLGADLAATLANIVATISFTGTAGTTYSANLAGQNGEVTATSTATTLVVTAITDTTAGNSIVTTTTSAVASWGGATLTGGGVHGLSGIAVPDGLPPGTVATLKSYVLVTIVGEGKFFWVKPGAVVIDALDFATAESKPDETVKVLAVGDTAWLIGQDSTEVWYATGDSTAPFAPVQGRTYDRGAIEGTAVNVKGTVFLVGPDKIVYAIAGAPQRVSTHGVEELIRKSL